MLNEKVISELNECIDYILDDAARQYDGALVYHENYRTFDKCRSSYIVELNMFGFPVRFIYVFDDADGSGMCDTVFVYDVEHDKMVLRTDVSEKYDLYDMVMAAHDFYGPLLHMCDSTGNFEIC